MCRNRTVKHEEIENINILQTITNQSNGKMESRNEVIAQIKIKTPGNYKKFYFNELSMITISI